MNDDDKKLPELKRGIPLSMLQHGGITEVTLDGEPMVLIDLDGKRCVLSGSCTHLGAPMSKGVLVDGEIRCPWHHARFDLGSGEAVGAPAFEPLKRYALVEHEGVLALGEQTSLPKPAAVKNKFDGRIVIVGAGAGGHACAEMLARHGYGADVVLIGDEAQAPYDRTFCSKQYLAGKKHRADAALPALTSLGVSMLTDTTAVSIDTVAKSVVLSNGERLDYSSLVIATGAAPVPGSFEGSDQSNVHLLRTLDDADRIIAAATKGTKAAVVGASFIGLEVAASLTARGLTVTVIAPDAIPLAAKMGEEVGNFVQSLHQDNGVAFRLERKVASYDGHTLTLDDGSTVEAELVVVGIGVVPRTELAERAGIVLADKDGGAGIEVDLQLRSSASDVYAIGDVASYLDARLGKRFRVEHWVHAQRQGQFVARLMLGQTDQFIDTPFFWSGHYDKSLRYVGHGSPDDYRVDGNVAQGDFAIEYGGNEGLQADALLTCGRDAVSIDREHDWDLQARTKQ